MKLPLLFVLFAFCTLSLRAAADRPPNVVLIFADDLGYADLSSFGAKGYRTPHLDRLAAQGRKFTNFHVAQAVCSASRAALLTGCYSNRVGFHGAIGPESPLGLAASEITLAELLKQRDYATGMAGKWHLGRPAKFLPTTHGFDEYFGLPYSNDMWPNHPEAKTGTYPPLPLLEGDRVIQDGLTGADQEQLTTRYTERAVSFIAKNKSRPFFFYLAHNMPHVPLYVSDKFRGKSGAGIYGDVIMEIDWSVGEIMRALDEHKLADNTLVIFTSDNGPWLSYGTHAGSSGQFREGKGTAWEGGTRVPCIMRLPGKIPAGTTTDAMLMTIDLFPTIAALTKTKLPAHKIDGLDAWPLLSGEKGAKNPHDGYAYYYEKNQLQAVSTGDGRWKLHFPRTYRTLGGKPGGIEGKPVKYQNVQLERAQLFDLQTDPGETTDVLAAQPAIMAQLEAFAEKTRADLGDALTNREGTGLREPDRVK